MSEPRYTAKALADMTGLSERTVRYYLAEGLLPPPAARGRGPNFSDDHLLRLRLIRAMQRAGNDLETIGEYLQALEGEMATSGATVESVLAVWNGRNERADFAEQWRGKLQAAEPLVRYRLVPGVELLITAGQSPAARRMPEILERLRKAFEEEDE